MSQGEDHVIHSVDITEGNVAAANDNVSNDSNDVINDNEQLMTTTTTSASVDTTINELPSVITDDVTTMHTLDHVISSDDHVIPDDHIQHVTTSPSVQDSPG